MNNDELDFSEFFRHSEDDEKLMRELTDFVKKHGKKAYDCFTKIQEAGGWRKFVNTAWYGEEKETSTFTFKECIEWVKPFYDKEKHSGAIIAKKQTEDRLLIKVCFLGMDGKPLSDEESHFLIVRCNEIDENLKNQFGDKNVIILR